MDYKLLLVENNEGIVTITINNEKSLNALNAALMAELADAFTAINKEQAGLLLPEPISVKWHR